MSAEQSTAVVPDRSGTTSLSERVSTRREGVMALARRCNWHASHSMQVAKLARQLLGQLGHRRSVSSLPRLAAEWLEYGALLHDIGYIVDIRKHHKHAYRLIREADLPGLLPREVGIVALLARFHRKRWRGPDHAPFADVDPLDYEAVRVLTAVLRVADGLDRSQRSVVQEIAVGWPTGTAQPLTDRLELGLSVAGNADVEMWAARRKSGLLEDVMGCPILMRVECVPVHAGRHISKDHDT